MTQTTRQLRWSTDQLVEITGKQRQSAQRRWFKLCFGVDVPCDPFGPIMTDSTYEALLQRRCGLTPPAANDPIHDRPQVRQARDGKGTK